MGRFEVKTQWEARGEIDSTVADPGNQVISVYDNKTRTRMDLSLSEVIDLWNDLWTAHGAAKIVKNFSKILRDNLKLEFECFGEGIRERRVTTDCYNNTWLSNDLSDLQQALVDRMVDRGEIHRADGILYAQAP